jgi:hypothetical protein
MEPDVQLASPSWQSKIKNANQSPRSKPGQRIGATSKHANIKELRVKVLKVQWRFAFAFDPERKTVVLCGGAKSGVSQGLFYKRLIDLADKRYDEHLSGVEKKRG